MHQSNVANPFLIFAITNLTHFSMCCKSLQLRRWPSHLWTHSCQPLLCSLVYCTPRQLLLTLLKIPCKPIRSVEPITNALNRLRRNCSGHSSCNYGGCRFETGVVALIIIGLDGVDLTTFSTWLSVVTTSKILVWFLWCSCCCQSWCLLLRKRL